jgi:hypothetical protein
MLYWGYSVMLMLFSAPKPFRNHIKVIQENIIQSWERPSSLSTTGIILISGFIEAGERNYSVGNIFS